ncbi:MAG: molybdenum cofactor guanylyltransferase [Candidatus Omnitrophica bacterium]|nr:molybdenum cofactor guanylyltransferase [Candidatus Omnitrophota bacterium]
MRIKGIVLAGGKSKRFGTDKAFFVYQGAPLLERAVSLLDSLRLSPCVMTRRGGSYPFLLCPVMEDKLPDKGPLGGVYTAMEAFPGNSLLVLSCDMPALTAEALSFLLSEHREQNSVTLFSAGPEEFQPFPGIYAPAVFPLAAKHLREDKLSMQDLLKGLPDKQLVLWRGDPRIFLNVNQMKDLEA